jgi:hypothetical protein
MNKGFSTYDLEILSYAQRWAELMEKEIDSGKDLANIAEITSHTADINGITGFMYSAAVLELSNNWKFGKELLEWHNIRNQIGNEGELANKTGRVLNTATIVVETEDAETD